MKRWLKWLDGLLFGDAQEMPRCPDCNGVVFYLPGGLGQCVECKREWRLREG